MLHQCTDCDYIFGAKLYALYNHAHITHEISTFYKMLLDGQLRRRNGLRKIPPCLAKQGQMPTFRQNAGTVQSATCTTHWLYGLREPPVEQKT